MGTPGAKLFAYDSMLGHLGNIHDIEKANPVILQFLSPFSKDKHRDLS